MSTFSLALRSDSEYNTLYCETPAETAESSVDYMEQLENQMRELVTLLECCTWTPYEKRELVRELREARLAYYELKILLA